MKWFIRRVIKKGKGSLQYEEEIHFGETLTIGRAANQAIFINDLRAALEHARVVALGNGRYRVESLVAAGVRIDGRFEHAATATAGSTLEVGNVRITLVDPPKDFEAAVEVGLVDKAEVAAREVSEALPQSLSEAGLGKRRWSWALLLLTLTFGLAIPLTAHFVPTFRSLTKDVPAVGMSAWDTGPLASAHRTMANDCQSCHGTPFNVVEDDKCIVCHAGTKAHADPVRYALPEIAAARCAHCHRDHNGDTGLVRADQELCSDCHRNLTERVNNDTQLANVGDFGTDHPQFKVLLPAWDAQGKFTPERVSMDQKPLTERSGLKFPHSKHLAAEGLKTADGVKKLECANCHAPEPGGALLAPIDFEQHCQSCHGLSFDLFFPDRQVVHGDVAQVQFTLAEFYSKVALEGGYGDVKAPVIVRERRRPGQPAMTAQEQRDALAWAREKATEVTDTLFNSVACTQCHTVTKDPAATQLGWVVAPVRVAGAWYEKASFTHAKHATMGCKDCHAADLSLSSADLLIPDIGAVGSNNVDPPFACRDCHGGEDAKHQLGSTCIDCHGFHQADMPLRVAK
ncbi:MAG TPA: cytochrome c3 family protein [Xanthomonadales bacterium]|nr:cytochrome c3 family protein [Xanthomonadales bacterium]